MMRSIRDILSETNALRARKLSPYQKEMVENFYQVLREWEDGDLTLKQVETATGTPYERFMMMMSTSPHTYEWEMMQRFFEAIVKRDRGPGVMTSSGWITEHLIVSQQGKIVDVRDSDGVIRQAAVFPTGYGVGFDNKPDMSLPIYGEEPGVFTPETFPASYSTPQGYYEWHGHDVS